MPVPSLYLPDLHLDELEEFNRRIDNLTRLGRRAAELGEAPRFDLTYTGLLITLPPIFPDRAQIAASISTPVSPPPEAAVETGGDPDPTLVAATFLDDSDSTKTIQFDLSCPEAAASTPDPLSKAEPEPLDLPVEALTELVPSVPAPDPASALAAASHQPLPWTQDEDAMAVAAAIRGRMNGETWHHLGEAIGKKLARPASGVTWRLKNMLLDRITIGITKAEAPPKPAPRSAPPSAPKLDPVPVAPTPVAAVIAATPKPAPAPAVGGSAVLGHLVSAAVGKDTRWSVEADLELMNLSGLGWNSGEVAAEMGRDTRAVKERFDLLTGLHRDEVTDKWVRRFTVDALALALAAMAKPAAAE